MADGDASASEVPNTDAEADEICDRNVALIPPEMLSTFFHPHARLHRRRCRTCVHHYCDHLYEPAAVAAAIGAPGEGGGGAGAGGTGGTSSSKYLKTLEKVTEAHRAIQHFTTTYTPVLNQQPPAIDVDSLFRYADALHHGFSGCPDVPEGDLPQRPTRSGLLGFWKRAKAYANVFDMIGAAFTGHIHTMPAAANFNRATLVEGGTGLMSSDEVLETSRTCQLMAIGLREMARRDKAVWKLRYEGAPARRQVAVVGSVVWFVEFRIGNLNHLRDWSKRAFKAGVYGRTAARPAAAAATAAGAAPATAAGAGPAAAAAAAGAGAGGGGGGGVAAGAGAGATGLFDIAAVAKEFPWVGIGHAVVTRGGRVETEGTDQAWSAVSAGEMVVAEAAKQLCHGLEPTAPAPAPASASAGGAGAGAGAGGGGGGQVRGRDGSASPTSKRAAKRLRKDAAAAARLAATQRQSAGVGAGGGGGGGGVASPTAGAGGAAATAGSPGRAQIEAARASFASIPVDQIGLDECRAADLCRNCKRPYHGNNCTEALRGKKL